MIEQRSEPISFYLNCLGIVHANAIVHFRYRRAVGQAPAAVAGIVGIATTIGVVELVAMDLNVVVLRSDADRHAGGGLLGEPRTPDQHVLRASLDMQAHRAAPDRDTIDDQPVDGRDHAAGAHDAGSWYGTAQRQ